jgi:predicted PurR-regulated permease PerM
VAHAHDIAEWVQSLATAALPPPPAWLARVPLVGAHFAARWSEAASLAPGELGARIAPYTRPMVAWVIRTVGGLGLLAVQFLLVVLFSAILYASGERAAAAARRFARRLAGDRGERSAHLAAQAIRGVALGVVLTALVQGGLAGVGLFVAGVPFPGILTALVFLLCVAQIGAGPVMALAVFWAYWSGAGGWGTALLLWSLVVLSVDNVVRPILIRKGADLPLLLVFVAVAGGLLAFGVVGIFVGPAVLAVGYRLLGEWIDAPEPPVASPRPPRREVAVPR